MTGVEGAASLFWIIDSRNNSQTEAEQTKRSLLEQGVRADCLIELTVSQKQAAIHQIAEKDFAYIEAGATIADGAVALISEAIKNAATPTLFYADSDSTLRPDWSPQRMLSYDYLGQLWWITAGVATVDDLALLRQGAVTEFLLRVSSLRDSGAGVSTAVTHLRHRLYAQTEDHRRSRAVSAQRQVQNFLDSTDSTDSTGQSISVSTGEHDFLCDLEYQLDSDICVSIVIPTRGTKGTVFGREQVFVLEAVRSVLAHTAHERLEFVIVADTATPPEVRQSLEGMLGDRLTWVPYAKPFNFSEKCNVGFLASRGDRIVMLNDDIQVCSERFVERLVAPLCDETIGMTGAFLLFEDGTIQHVGHWYQGRSPRHAMITQGADQDGPDYALSIDREVSGLTAACVALRRETYELVGGFSEVFPSNYNDVDFSYKINALSLRMIWLHKVRAFHFESKTRVGTVHEWERILFGARWGIAGFDRYWTHTS